MAVLGELTVNLIARTGKFEQGIDRSRKKTKQFKEQTDKAADSFKRFAAGLAAGITVSAIVSYGKRQTEAAAALADTADKLGINIQRLQAYQFQAKNAGLTQQTLNTALQRMVRRVSEAAAGTGEAKKALAELGLNAKELAKLKPGDIYESIGAAMQRIGIQGDRVRLAMRVFDTEGVGLVNAFAQGVKQSRLEFEKIGSAITSEQGKRAQEFMEAYNRLAERLASVGRNLVIDVTPNLLRAIDRIESLIATTRGFEDRRLANIALGGEGGIVGIEQRARAHTGVGRRELEAALERRGQAGDQRAKEAAERFRFYREALERIRRLEEEGRKERMATEQLAGDRQIT